MPRHATADEITEWSRDHIAQTLSRPRERIDPDAKLSRQGLDSATSVELMIALEEWLDIELTPELAMEHQTLGKLCGFVAGVLATKPVEWNSWSTTPSFTSSSIARSSKRGIQRSPFSIIAADAVWS